MDKESWDRYLAEQKMDQASGRSELEAGVPAALWALMWGLIFFFWLGNRWGGLVLGLCLYGASSHLWHTWQANRHRNRRLWLAKLGLAVVLLAVLLGILLAMYTNVALHMPVSSLFWFLTRPNPYTFH